MKREFLQLCHEYNPKKHRPDNMFMSEKLNGMRAFWDGGFSRNIGTVDVPYANNTKSISIATGLWSRYGNVIHAPDWFLDGLPSIALDGELYTGNFQELRSIVGHVVPDDRWHQVKYWVFDSPTLSTVLADGVIDNINFKKKFVNCYRWAVEKGCNIRGFSTFKSTCEFLKLHVVPGVVDILPQELCRSVKDLDNFHDTVCGRGGEGVILHSPYSYYACERSWNCLKVKKYQDSEAEVVGYVWGEGKLLGLMGSLVVVWRGNTFKLSGFTESERGLFGEASIIEGIENPGKRSVCVNRNFPVGSMVTFKFRSLTDAGLPVEASYLRKS